MTSIIFYKHGGTHSAAGSDGKVGDITGFEVSGHSTENESDEEGRLVCSAVSSAAIMTANTVTEIIRDGAAVEAYDGYLSLKAESIDKCRDILLGFELHVNELAKQYPDRIEVLEKSV